MKSRLLIIIGVVIATGIIASFSFLPDGKQNTCEQMGGTWNADDCIITQETFDSNKLTCDPEPVLENGTCSSNGIKLVIEPESEFYQETKTHLPPINSKNKWVNPELESKQGSVMTFDYVIESDNATYGSQYEITGGIVDEITYDAHSNSLIISLNESEQGYITIVIQTGLLHSHDQLPFTYFVIVNGEEVVFEQLSPIVLKIPFEKDTQKIEIIGTFW